MQLLLHDGMYVAFSDEPHRDFVRMGPAAGVLQYVLLSDAPVPMGLVTAQRFDWRALGTLWLDRQVHASVFAYFGHMWELYTVWVAVPLLLATRIEGAGASWAAFLILGSGALSCIAGGGLVRRWGSARVGAFFLGTSGLCCLAAPLAIDAPTAVFYGWLLLWGLSVSSDSPQFSALTASNASAHAVGSVLTLTNSIGFTVSIVSIELFSFLVDVVPVEGASCGIGGGAGSWVVDAPGTPATAGRGCTAWAICRSGASRVLI
jgi:hypothetical protein